MIKVTYIINNVKEEDIEFSPLSFLDLLKDDLDRKLSIIRATINDFELNCIELQNNLIL